MAVESLPNHLGMGVDLSSYKVELQVLHWYGQTKRYLQEKTGQVLRNSALAKGRTQSAELKPLGFPHCSKAGVRDA